MFKIVICDSFKYIFISCNYIINIVLLAHLFSLLLLSFLLIKISRDNIIFFFTFNHTKIINKFFVTTKIVFETNVYNRCFFNKY